jgi:hypothetical protein
MSMFGVNSQLAQKNEIGQGQLIRPLDFAKIRGLAEQTGLLPSTNGQGQTTNAKDCPAKVEAEVKNWRVSLERICAEPLVALALNTLATQLSPKLTYHNYEHTAHQVFPIAVLLAQKLGLPERKQLLAGVAAAWHDMGFLQKPDGLGHEVEGAALMLGEMASRANQPNNRICFDMHEKLECCQAVLESKLVPNREQARTQVPTGVLGRIICTADLITFAAPFKDFFYNSGLVFNERFGDLCFSIESMTEHKEGRKFLLESLKMFNHHYWTLVPDDCPASNAAQIVDEINSPLGTRQAENLAIFREELKASGLFSVKELEETVPAYQRLKAWTTGKSEAAAAA